MQIPPETEKKPFHYARYQFSQIGWYLLEVSLHLYTVNKLICDRNRCISASTLQDLRLLVSSRCTSGIIRDTLTRRSLADDFHRYLGPILMVKRFFECSRTILIQGSRVDFVRLFVQHTALDCLGRDSQ